MVLIKVIDQIFHIFWQSLSDRANVMEGLLNKFIPDIFSVELHPVLLRVKAWKLPIFIIAISFGARVA